MKKITALIIAAVLVISAVAVLSSCGSENTQAKSFTIAVPNDTTNEARALLLLEANGLIKLKEGAGITAGIYDIEENPYNIEFKEVEAAQIPGILQDMDFAVINSNYAIEAGINPMESALIMEGSASAYSNIIAVKEGNENTDKIKALVAACQSERVAQYITEKYAGSVVSTVDNPGDGYDPSVDYAALEGTEITVAASPAPHKEILDVVRDILEAKGIKLTVIEYTDYIVPNKVVESGEVDANYFQHLPYLEDFNAENGTHIVSAAAIHVEPMGLYGGKLANLEEITGYPER